VRPLRKVIEAYEFSQMLNPDWNESEFELSKVARLLREMPLPNPYTEETLVDLDIIVTEPFGSR